MSTAVNCPNCEAPLGGHFCANCGQEAILHHASTREFLHEFIGHYVALEGKLWGSLTRLLFRPGLLTNEYIRGRRVRFVQPLRLYLTLSLLFFALMKFTGSFELRTGDAEPDSVAAQVAESKQEHANADAAPADAKPAVKWDKTKNNEAHPERDKVDSWLADWPRLRHQWHAFDALPGQEQLNVAKDGFYHYGPYVIFCLMPVFALFLKVLYLGSGRRFGEHVLFALHTNAFAYFMFCVMLLVPFTFVRFVLWLWVLGYLPWAMRRVYHSGRFTTFLRWSALMLAYVFSLGIAVVFSMAIGVMTIH